MMRMKIVLRPGESGNDARCSRASRRTAAWTDVTLRGAPPCRCKTPRRHARRSAPPRRRQTSSASCSYSGRSMSLEMIQRLLLLAATPPRASTCASDWSRNGWRKKLKLKLSGSWDLEEGIWSFREERDRGAGESSGNAEALRGAPCRSQRGARAATRARRRSSRVARRLRYEADSLTVRSAAPTGPFSRGTAWGTAATARGSARCARADRDAGRGSGAARIRSGERAAAEPPRRPSPAECAPLHNVQWVMNYDN